MLNLLSTLPTALRILPYFGYLDQCYYLMTLLSSETAGLMKKNLESFSRQSNQDSCVGLKKRIVRISGGGTKLTKVDWCLYEIHLSFYSRNLREIRHVLDVLEEVKASVTQVRLKGVDR